MELERVTICISQQIISVQVIGLYNQTAIVSVRQRLFGLIDLAEDTENANKDIHLKLMDRRSQRGSSIYHGIKI
jgi:hypothetical protein